MFELEFDGSFTEFIVELFSDFFQEFLAILESRLVVIANDIAEGGFGYVALYVGQVVKSGAVIGTCGYDTQGTAMGQGKAALYFEVRSGTQALDPMIYLRER